MLGGRERRVAVFAGAVAAAGLFSLPLVGSAVRVDELVRLETVAPELAIAADAVSAFAPQKLTGTFSAPAPSAEPVTVAPPPLIVDASASVLSDMGTSDEGGDVPYTLAGDSMAGGQVWAVVIGIDDYRGDAHDLAYATEDADDVVSALNRFGVPGSNILTVRDREATSRNVLRAVRWLVRHAGPDDTAVFFYAGHAREFGPDTEAIITTEGGWVTDWYLAERFEDLEARDAWFVFASCFGGGFDELLAPGRILTGAAGPDALAYESDAFGRSYLGEYVIRRGLLEGGAGSPVVQDAVGWAQTQLAAEHPANQIMTIDLAGHPVSLDGRPHEDPLPVDPVPPDDDDGGGGGNWPPVTLLPPPPPPPPPGDQAPSEPLCVLLPALCP